MQAGVWTVPPERMKPRKEHKVPLSKRAIELLRALPREAGGFHFIGSKGGESIGVNSMAVVMKSLRKSGGVTVHGFRSAFRDWAEERTAFPAIVAELALAHVVGDAVQNAYRRTVLIEKRAQLVQAWSDYCDMPASKSAKLADVTPMRRRP